METKKRGRPRYEDPNQVRKRHNVMLLPEIQEMARELGDGNVSRGLEMAVREIYGKNQAVR